MVSKKTIIITGSTSGIGESLSYEYASKGARLFLFGRNQAKLKLVKEKCKALGAELVLDYICDVTDANKAKLIIDDIFASYKVDLIICAAGISSGTANADNDENIDREIFETNIIGMINIISPAIPYFIKANSGQIAVFSSLAIYYSPLSSSSYVTSKETIKSYGNMLRNRLRKYNIDISIILPGFVNSRMANSNNYPKIFMMNSVKAAKIIERKLHRSKDYIIFPWQIYIIGKIFSLLPHPLKQYIKRLVGV